MVRWHVAGIAFGLISSGLTASPFTQTDIDSIHGWGVRAPFIMVYSGMQRRMVRVVEDVHYKGENNGAGAQELWLKPTAGPKETLLRFRVPSFSTVDSAHLFLRLTAEVKTAKTQLCAHRCDTLWDQATVTRSTSPVTGEEVGCIDVVGRKGWVSLPLDPGLLSQASTLSFKLRSTLDNIGLSAREAEYPSFNLDGSHGNKGFNIFASKAFHAHAVACFYDSLATSSDGIALGTRLLETVRWLIAGGHEPNASGRVEGWSHGPIAQALLLVRMSPGIWQQLSADEQNRCDWLMRALAVAANWCYADSNDYKGTLGQTGSQIKTWNPNHVEGYVGALIAATLYFGGETLDSMFAAFSYDEYMVSFAKLGFTNITGTWEQTGRAVMEGIVTDNPNGGSGIGIQAPFTYSGDSRHLTIDKPPATLEEPFMIFRRMALKMYHHRVTSQEKDGACYIISGRPSPWEGQEGMCFEFRAGDYGGLRSDARYSYDGWMNSVRTAQALLAADRWGEGIDRKALEALQSRMSVGSNDLMFKLAEGYHGRANGKYGDDYAPWGLGYGFTELLWMRTLEPAFENQTTSHKPVRPAAVHRSNRAAPEQIEAYDLTGRRLYRAWVKSGHSPRRNGSPGIRIIRHGKSSGANSRVWIDTQ